MGNNATEFFEDIDTDNELNDFIGHMKTPVEEIPEMEWDDDGMGPIGEDPEQAEEATTEAEEPDPNMEYFNYSKGHALTAELGLNAIDRFTSNLAAFFTDKSPKYYRDKINKEDHENDVNITAAMIKKYEVKIGIEWWFLMAIVGRYTSMVKEGVKEARKPQAVDIEHEEKNKE